MQLERFADVGAFLARVRAFLVAREAEHNLLFAIASTLEERPAAHPGPNYLAVVTLDDQVVAAAIQTPPFGLVLSEIDRIEALDLLGDDLATVALPSVLGPAEHARTFARRYADRSGGRAVLESSQRIFRLTAVRPPRPARGRLRPAVPADRELLVDWFSAFEREALHEDDPAGISEVVDDHLVRGGIHLWDDDGPVSFVGVGGRTPNGVLLEGGYTPPALRGRGYGSNIVAELSRSFLEDGARFVFLFTDLANPTSNHVYVGLGCEPVRDVEEWRFEAR